MCELVRVCMYASSASVRPPTTNPPIVPPPHLFPVSNTEQEEVLADPHWLDNRWAEKDRVLTYFGRTEQFPAQASNGACVLDRF